MISLNSGHPLFCKAEMSKRIKSVCGDRGGCRFLTAAETVDAKRTDEGFTVIPGGVSDSERRRAYLKSFLHTVKDTSTTLGMTMRKPSPLPLEKGEGEIKKAFPPKRGEGGREADG